MKNRRCPLCISLVAIDFAFWPLGSFIGIARYLCKQAMNFCFCQYSNTSTNTSKTNASKTNTSQYLIVPKLSIPIPPIPQYHQYQSQQYLSIINTNATNTSILIKAFNTNSQESWYCDMPSCGRLSNNLSTRVVGRLKI